MFSTSLKNTFPGSGVHKNGPYLSLGGTLTGDTVITGTTSGIIIGSTDNTITASFSDGIVLESGENSGVGIYLNEKNGSGIWIDSENQGGIFLNSDGGGMTIKDNGNNASISIETQGTTNFGLSLLAKSASGLQVSGFQLRPTSLKFIDGRTGTTAVGLEYDDDYSANFTSRSLVDKAYVTGLTSTLVTANNGLTKIGSNVRLGGTLTGNTLIDTNSRTFIVDYGTAFETGSTAIVRATVGGTQDVTHLAFRHNSARSLNHGFSDIRLGTLAGNPNSPAGGNITIGQNILTSLVTSGSFTAAPYFSTFRGDRNVAIGFDIATGWTNMGANQGSSNIMFGVRAGKTSQPFSYSIVGGFEASANITGDAATWESVVALGTYALSGAEFLSGATGSYGYLTVVGPHAGQNATFRDGYGTTLIGANAGYNATLLEDYEVLIGGAGENASLGRGNIGIGQRAFYGAVGGSAGAIGVGTNQFNVAVGTHAMEGSGPSEKGTYVGCEAGQGVVIGQKNSGFGSWSLPRINGHHNTGIGAYAGYMGQAITGNGNTFIGPSTGLHTSTLAVNNVMVIGNPNAISSTGGYRPIAESDTVYVGSVGDIVLTQDWNGSPKTVRFNASGLTYGGDYSSSFTDRSLVDKGYVDNVSAGGGVTLTSVSIELDETVGVVLVDTSLSGVTITLSTSIVDKKRLLIKDITGDGSINNILIDGNGIPIDGESTATVNTNRGAIELFYSDDNAEWYIISFVN